MPNVSVSNTPGLYIGSGASGVLNSAQQLYALLSNSGNVNFALINNNTAVQSYFIGNAGGGTYSNTNVAAYLPTYTGTLDNSSTIVTLFGNAATQALAIAATNANLGAFQTYANNTFGTSSFGNANVALYLPTYTGTLDNSSTIVTLFGNAATQATSINTINANLGAFQTFSNANAATQATSINTIDANLGAFQTYANNTFGTSSYGNANVAAYLPTYTGTLALSSTIIDLYSNAATQASNINGINANLGAYQTYTNVVIASSNANVGTLYLGNIAVNANLGAFQTYANATFSTGGGSTYGNSNVAAYLPTYTGNIGNENILTGYRYLYSGNIDVVSNNTTATGGIINLRALKPSGFGNINITGGQVGIGYGLDTGDKITLNGPTDFQGYGLSGNIFSFARGNVVIQSNSFTSTAKTTTGGYLVVGNSVIIGDKITSANLQSTEGTITNRITAGNVTTANGVFYSNGVNILNNVTGNYSNTNVAAYLTTSTTIITNANAGPLRLQNTANTAYVQVGQVGGIPDFLTVYSANLFLGSGGVYPLNIDNFAANINAIGNFINFYPVSGNPNSGNIGVKVRGNIQATSNITGAFFLGDGSQLTNLPAASYGNTQVAAYLPTYTGSLALSSSIVSLNANLGAYQTFANANVSSLQNQITGANNNITTNTTGISTINANLGAFQTYANNTFGTSGYGNTQVAAYLPTYTGNISGNSINLTFDSVANKFVSTTGYFWSNGTAYSTGGGGGGGSDFTSNLTINGNYILNGNINLIREKWANIGTIQGTTTIDANVAMIQTALVVANLTINTTNLTNFNPGQSVTLKLTQGTNANLRILTSNILFAGGSKTLSTANAAIDTVSITYDGEAYLAALVKGYS